MPSNRRSRAAVGALLFALSAAACADDSQLSATLDSVGTQVDVATAQAGLNLTVVRSFIAVGPQIEAAFDSYSPALRTTGSTASLLPLLAWGKTFVWSGAEGRYIESDRTGAPPSGSRFILYAVSGLGVPTTPLTEQGYVDITRAQNTATVVIYQTTEVEVMRYDLTTGGTESVPTFLVDGFAGTGTSRTTFDLSASLVTSTGNLTQTWSTSTLSRGLATTVQLAEGPLSTTVGGTMRAGVRKIEIGGTLGTTGAGALPVKVGGKLYGRVLLSGGTPGTTTVTNPLGGPLGAAETTAIAATYSWFASSYTKLGMFLAPLYTVLDVDHLP